jgi:integrase
MTCIKCKKTIPDGSSFCNFCGKKQTTEKRRSRRRANGQGSVIKLSGNRTKPYAVMLPASYDDNGNKKQRYYGYYSTKTEALNVLNELITRGVNDNIGLSLSQTYEEWSSLKFRELSKSAVSNYNAAYKFFQPLRDKKFKDIRAIDVQQIVDSAVELGKSRATCEKIRNLYSQLCQYAMSIDVLTQNYAKFLVMPAEDKAEKEPFTPEEVEKIAVAAEHDETAMIIMIFFYTGFRINELFQITKDRVHLDGDIPYIVGGAKTDAGKDRIIPIHSKIFPYVEYFFKKSSKYLIPNTKGGMNCESSINAVLKYAAKKAGIDHIGTHAFRDTYATRGAFSGVNRNTLAALLGHSDPAITDRYYISVPNDEKREAVEMIRFAVTV